MAKIIDRAAFFDDIRPLYGGSLSQAQVNEMDPALTKWEQAFDANGEAAAGSLAKRWIEAPAGTTPGQLVLSERGAQVLVDREGLRTTAVKVGRRIAEELTWDRCARATADVYREVLEEA